MKYIFPVNYGENCILVPIDSTLVPLISGALNKFLTPAVWQTRIDYELGYNAIAEVLAAMGKNCLVDLVEGQNRIYRLLDTALNGTAYTEADGDISPMIPAVPPASTDEPNAIRAHIGRLWHLAENAHTGQPYPAGAGVEGAPALPANLSWAARLLAVQGVTDAGWLLPDEPVTLKRLLEAGRINSPGDKTSIKDAIQTITGTVSAGGTIADAIGDYLSIAADAGTDGGVIAVQLATSAALLGTLQRINKALNGAPIPDLDTPSLLFVLRGNNVISTENNMLSRLAAGLFVQSADLGDGLGGDFGVARYLAARLGETDQTTPLAHLSNISQRIGAAVGGLSVNQQLDAIRVATRAAAGLEAAGQAAQGTALRLMLDLLDCICVGVNGTPSTPSIPPWQDVLCPDDPVLTATFTFSGALSANGSLATGLQLDGTPPGWTTYPGDSSTGPLLAYTGGSQISSCYVAVAVEGYAGSIGAKLTPMLLDPLGGEPGRSSPDNANPGPTSFTFYRAGSGGSEQFIGYACSVAIGQGDPPLDGSQVRVYIGRPDAGTEPPG